MAIIRLILLVILSALIFLIACDDSPTRYSNNLPPVPQDFPGAAGMLWKYEVYDSLTQITDTVWVSYTDNYFGPSGDFFIEWKERHFTDYSFEFKTVRAHGDTIEIQNSDIVLVFQSERIIYPIELGNSWAGIEAIDDTSRVTLVGKIEVPAETFYNGARIDRSWNLDIEQGGNWSQTWLVPDVGIVSRYFLSQFSDGTSITVTKNETWELIEYDLTTFVIDQFPNKVGNRWIYEEKDSVYYHHDSVIITYDTVTVTIVDEGRLEMGDSFTVWEYVNSMSTDTLFVVTQENHIRFHTMYSPLWDLYYEFPLAVGRSWGIDYFVPVPEVIDKETVIAPLRIFESAFHQKTNGGAFNDYWSQDDWLVPEIGIVKSTRWQFGFIPSMNRTRTLIDYSLVD